MSITKYFDILFLACKGCLVIRAGQLRQVVFRSIMNTRVHMILKALLVSSRMVKRILKEYKRFIWESKVLQVLLRRRRMTPPNKESLGERIRKQTLGQVIFYELLGH